MLRAWYLRRAVPWAAMTGFLGVAALLTGMAGRWESMAGLALPVVALLSAAAVAFLFDDAAAAVTSVTPRGGRWARGSRAGVALAPLAVGTALLAAAPVELRGDRTDWALVVAGIGAVVLLAAAAGGVRQAPRPGGQIAASVVLAGMVPLVIGLFFDLRSPYPSPALSEGMRLFWVGALAVGVAATAALVTGGDLRARRTALGRR